MATLAASMKVTVDLSVMSLSSICVLACCLSLFQIDIVGAVSSADLLSNEDFILLVPLVITIRDYFEIKITATLISVTNYLCVTWSINHGHQLQFLIYCTKMLLLSGFELIFFLSEGTLYNSPRLAEMTSSKERIFNNLVQIRLQIVWNCFLKHVATSHGSTSVAKLLYIKLFQI